MCIFLFSACAHAQCATSIVQFLRPELYVYVLLNLLYYTGDEGGMAKFGHLQEFDTDLEPITAYLERVELYFSANGIGEDKKLAILLSVIGPKTYGVLRNLLAPTRPQEKKFSEVLIRHFEPKLIVIAERFSFYRRSQLVGESVADFVAELRRLARNCQFGDILDEALRDRLVCGFQNEAIERRLLTEAKLTFAGALELAKAQEAAELQAKQFKDPDIGVHKLSRTRLSEKEYKRAMHSLWTKKSSSRSMPVEGLYLSQIR